jgi:Dna[CI] antecedent DciA-like protein
MHQVPAVENREKSCLMNRADSLLGPFIKDLGIEDAVRLDEMKRNWNTLFREPLSFHMSPAVSSGGELLIIVDSPVWLQELNFYKEYIVKKLNLYGVEAVRFRLGRVPASVRSIARSEGPRFKQLKAEEHSYIEEIISGIGDSELRGRVKKAMEKYLSNKNLNYR